MATHGYDAAGWMITVTDALAHTTTSVFDAVGRTLSRFDALGHANIWVFYAAGRTVGMSDATGAVTTYEHDACGMTAELDALRRRQGWGYDDLGRLIEAKARAATRGCMATMPWATASARPTRWGA